MVTLLLVKVYVLCLKRIRASRSFERNWMQLCNGVKNFRIGLLSVDVLISRTGLIPSVVVVPHSVCFVSLGRQQRFLPSDKKSHVDMVREKCQSRVSLFKG